MKWSDTYNLLLEDQLDLSMWDRFMSIPIITSEEDYLLYATFIHTLTNISDKWMD